MNGSIDLNLSFDVVDEIFRVGKKLVVPQLFGRSIRLQVPYRPASDPWWPLSSEATLISMSMVSNCVLVLSFCSCHDSTYSGGVQGSSNTAFLTTSRVLASRVFEGRVIVFVVDILGAET